MYSFKILRISGIEMELPNEITTYNLATMYNIILHQCSLTIVYNYSKINLIF